MSPPSLLSVPYEVLIRIALETACIDVLGPPVHLPALFATSRLCSTLARSVDLLASIFKAKFDISAPRRRVGPIAVLSRNLAVQLKRYCITLKRIRAGDVYAATLEEDLWSAYLMMTETDGKNAVQLIEYANLPAFANRFVRARLLENILPSGWPVESTVNSLALWLLWFVTDVPTMRAESRDEREQLIRLILPYVTCCFRYNAFHAADIHYNLPLLREELPELPHSLVTAHGPYPQYPDQSAVASITHFNQRITISRPPIVQAAQLLYFARRELNGFAIPMGIPVDRAHALTLGQATGATRADYEELNAHPGARVLSWGRWDWRDVYTTSELRDIDDDDHSWLSARAPSARFDADWERLTSCYDPWAAPSLGFFARYAPGSMVGRWIGRMMIPDEMSYMTMIQDPVLPAYFSEIRPFSSMRPIMFTLKEYHCISPEEPVDFCTAENGLDEGVLNAYLPSLSMSVDRDCVTFTEQSNDPARRFRHRYENIVPGQPSSHSEETCAYCLHRLSHADQERTARLAEIEEAFEEAGVGRADMNMDVDSDSDSDSVEGTIEDGNCHGVLDVVFTGLTEEAQGNAWCHYMYYGRLREWDGLIVLVGVPNDINDRLWGKWIFRGYLHGGQNFTGRWRHYAYDLLSPAYEGAFSLSKRDD
ncbi:hypothetical protein M0805_001425 [Coniferiporia weirii]|nr:hypothetical protein M0805_001425 [Coniferiporia weirii]